MSMVLKVDNLQSNKYHIFICLVESLRLSMIAKNYLIYRIVGLFFILRKFLEKMEHFKSVKNYNDFSSLCVLFIFPI